MLEDATYKNTPPFVPSIRHGKVIKTYDGDTITVAARLHFEGVNTDVLPVYRFSVRLKGIDCPEMKSSDMNEKEVARKAKDFVQELVLNQFVELQNVETEKYGRLLADVIYQGNSLAQLLINEHLAVPYDGGHKEVPSNWLEYWNSKK